VQALGRTLGNTTRLLRQTFRSRVWPLGMTGRRGGGGDAAKARLVGDDLNSTGQLFLAGDAKRAFSFFLGEGGGSGWLLAMPRVAPVFFMPDSGISPYVEGCWYKCRMCDKNQRSALFIRRGQ
jgi:hypothetical protein